jgi:molybdenum cofactor cytidylyltransferase
MLRRGLSGSPYMSGSSKLCAVILAAGASSRMGRDKALLPWPPDSQSGTLLSAAILALRPLADRVIVVAGKNEAKLAPIAEAHGAIVVHNPEPERGQFSSLQTGLRAAVEGGCDAAMITPVDCPPLCAASLEALCAAFEQARARGAWAVAPENNGRRGHPLFVSGELIEAFLSAPVTSNAREVKRAHADKFEYMPVPDALLTADLNTPEEYVSATRSAR